MHRRHELHRVSERSRAEPLGLRDLFAEVNEGARVTLKFHFWSGAIVTYYVTKSGTTVTGSTS